MYLIESSESTKDRPIFIAANPCREKSPFAAHDRGWRPFRLTRDHKQAISFPDRTAAEQFYFNWQHALSGAHILKVDKP